MKLNELKDNQGSRKGRMRVGRGIGSGKGTLDHEALKGAGLARGGKDGVRLLGKGELKAKLAFKIAGASKGARDAVEKAGGSIELIERKNPAELAAAKKGKVREKRLADQAAAKADA